MSDAIAIVGAAAVPVFLLALGATLYKGPGAGKVPVRVIVGSVVTKLIVSPVIGAAAVYGLYRWGTFHPPDRMFLLVMFSIHMAPSAMNVQVRSGSCPLVCCGLGFVGRNVAATALKVQGSHKRITASWFSKLPPR